MGEWKPEAFAGELGDALSKLDLARATELCEQLAQQIARKGHAYPEAAARRHLRELRGKCYYDARYVILDAGEQNGQRVRI